MSVLRQATKGTSDALMDKLLLEFLTEADLELQNASTNRSRQKIIHRCDNGTDRLFAYQKYAPCRFVRFSHRID